MGNSTRYLALDVLRGITIATMITVNTPGSWNYIYAPLKHAAWHGCTPTDLVFPFFLLVVGLSMFFSFAKFDFKYSGKAAWKILRRSVLIFAIGLFLNSFPQWLTDYSQLRILGVLQRIAIAYGVASFVVLWIPLKRLPWVAAMVLLFYWTLLYFGGGQDPYSLQGNVVAAVDLSVMGEAHLYHGFGIPFDPEGLLSTIPAVVTVWIGFMIGSVIYNLEKCKVPFRLGAIGLVGVAVGWIWSYWMPLNKPLWTSSYVLYTAGWGILLLALLIWIIDLRGHTRWTSFFVVFGMNPLFIFALSGLWAKAMSRLIVIRLDAETTMSGSSWLYQQVFVPWAGNMNGSLLYALTHILFFWLIGWVMYKKKIFVKV